MMLQRGPSQQDELAGQCPRCRRYGVVGQPCPEPVCLNQGAHAIPTAYLGRPGTLHADGLIGRALDDYLVVSVLGRGGFGRVYLALQRPLGMPVALKVANLEGSSPAATAAMVARFDMEARALAELNHPNVVRLLRYGTFAGQPYLVMEHVPGARTLEQLIIEGVTHPRSLTRDRVGAVLFPLLDALTAAHDVDIIHRDVKPDNVMLQPMPSGPPLVRLLDFGLAKFLAGSARQSTIMGTPAYMAPEQFSDGAVGPWTDLYAVGVIAFELLLGVRPFEGDTQERILGQKLDGAYDPLHMVPDASPTVAVFLRRALAPQASARFQTADAMRGALAEALATWEGIPASAPQVRVPFALPPRPSDRSETDTRVVAIVPAAAAGAPEPTPAPGPVSAAATAPPAAGPRDDAQDDDAPAWSPQRARRRRWRVAVAILTAGLLAGGVAWLSQGASVGQAQAAALGTRPLTVPAPAARLNAAAPAAPTALLRTLRQTPVCDLAAPELRAVRDACDALPSCLRASAERGEDVVLPRPLSPKDSLLIAFAPIGDGAADAQCGRRYSRSLALIDGAWDELPVDVGVYTHPQVVAWVRSGAGRTRLALAERARSRQALLAVQATLAPGAMGCVPAVALGAGADSVDISVFEEVRFYDREAGFNGERGRSPCELGVTDVMVLSQDLSG